MRWDSDHILLTGDELTATMREVVRSGLIDSPDFFMSLDYFDASIHRVAAWAIGLRSAGYALLSAMLEPFPMLREAELSGDLTARLALTEEFSRLPASAVWDYLCLTDGKPLGLAWLDEVKKYEEDVTSKR